jgi:hypothetical protein
MSLSSGVALQSSTAYLFSKKCCTDLGRRRTLLFLTPSFLRNEVVDNPCIINPFSIWFIEQSYMKNLLGTSEGKLLIIPPLI